MQKCYISTKNCLLLHCIDFHFGRFCMQFTEAPNMSEPKPEYSNNTKVKTPTVLVG